MKFSGSDMDKLALALHLDIAAIAAMLTVRAS
jgi:hypothetical protein